MRSREAWTDYRVDRPKAGRSEPARASWHVAQATKLPAWANAVGGATFPILQPKLTISQPGDVYEQEADRVANAVTRQSGTLPVSVGRGPQPDLIQRHGLQGDEEDDELILHRSPEDSSQPSPLAGLTTRIESMRGGGEPLSPETQQAMEAGFGCCLGDVRVHADGRASQMARSIGAQAFTVGDDVFFGPGKYQPDTEAGRLLLAHELAHVVQQRQAASLAIQRTVELVDPGGVLPGAPPRTKLDDIRDSVARLSPNFQVDATGAVTRRSGSACASPARTIDQCLCDMVSSPNTWRIHVDDTVWPHTSPGSHEVFVQSTRSGIDLGAWGGGAQAGQRVFMEQWRVLGHELCGHGWLFEQVRHPAANIVMQGGRIMSRPSHDPTVAIENQIARDVQGASAEERGLHAAPHAGESFGRITLSGFAHNSPNVSTLPGPERARLAQIHQFMARDADLRADVVGHADNTGAGPVNQRISTERAQNVRQELVNRGLGSHRFVHVEGVGTRDCTTAGRDPACRKVEVFMYIFQRASLRFP